MGQCRTHAAHKVLAKIGCGFYFLGYHFSPAGLTIAKKTVGDFMKNAARFYEQRRSAGLAPIAARRY
jgi:hypothetical protein